MLTMQIRFRPVFVALASLFAVDAALAQAPAAKPAAPAPAAPAPAAAPDDDAAAPPSDASPGEPGAGTAEPGGAEPAPGAEPAGAPATRPPKARVNPLPAFPEPAADANALQQMGQDRPAPARPKQDTDVFADDWWSHARPILELHGQFRVRGEMFYRFGLGRVDQPANSLWPRPPDAPYSALGGQVGTDNLCTADEADLGTSEDPTRLFPCKNNTQTGANLRFRLNPEIHISDNLRVVSQIDLLDNVVMGSTGSGYSVTPNNDGSYTLGHRSDYEPSSFADQSASPPRSGINSLSDSIHVKRVWGEYSTPVGELRFGRMPNHWGLGMVNNAGDGYDDDYQSTIDRVQFVFGVKPLDLYLSAALDFPNEGPTSEVVSYPGAQAYDLAKLDDVNQYVFSVARKKSFELTKLSLTRGELVVNGGVQLTYRQQLLTDDCAPGVASCTRNPAAPTIPTYSRRDAHYFLPDLWVQVLYGQFRFEAEAATIQGSTHNPRNDPRYETTKYDYASWGFATELEQRLVENKLHLGMNFGWSQGDSDVDGLEPGQNPNTYGQLGGDHTISTFRFNPAYRVDMILFRNILTRVQGAYYFRPSLGYDFIRDLTGQRLGGQIAGIWSRASNFMQSPGHDHDLGIELNGALYFQSKDGALNDEPSKMGGFYARLEYGILFTLKGLGYPAGTVQSIRNTPGAGDGNTTNAQILRLHLGVMF